MKMLKNLCAKNTNENNNWPNVLYPDYYLCSYLLKTKICVENALQMGKYSKKKKKMNICATIHRAEWLTIKFLAPAVQLPSNPAATTTTRCLYIHKHITVTMPPPNNLPKMMYK